MRRDSCNEQCKSKQTPYDRWPGKENCKKFIGTYKALKEALGERGTPGNAEYIIYVAEKLIEVYKSDHLWALDFKCISVPEMFEKLIEYTSELSKSIIEDIENFIDDYDKRINELSYGLEDISGEKVVSFNLELRSPDMNKIDAEIKRLGKILLNN